MEWGKIDLSETLVPPNVLKLALEAQKSKSTAITELLQKRKLPENGWTDEHIEQLVRQLSSLDSNNFAHRSGVGEREARIACRLVARRHYNFGHGMGRSGDLLEAQPKAAGSTVLANLTNALLLDLIREMGVRSCAYCFMVPMATGMTLMLCLLALKKKRPQAKYVLWSRIDQKSCIKCITAVGLEIIPVAQIRDTNGNLVTDIVSCKEIIEHIDHNRFVCIMSTTSCFAPRSCDNLIELAKLSCHYNLPHVVNNAYGLQSTYMTHQLEQAKKGITFFVQSTDKNLLVPVGGAILAGFDEELVRSVAALYPGRASSSQTLDVFMTLLSLGKNGYKKLAYERKKNFEYLRNELLALETKLGIEVFESKHNPISLAISLANLPDMSRGTVSKFGAMLYTRGISGSRVIISGSNKQIDELFLQNWGTHQKLPTAPYITVAASLGIRKDEINTFLKKFEECWQIFLKQTTNDLKN